ncbi:iron ABC transporter substrate-binding protein [Pasteurella multocida]|nr:iron ABC transporter substrate-binding protein [Pasteurella multocida]
MKFKKLSFAISSALLATGLLASQAYAKGRLVVYCSATNEMCEAEIKAFGEKYDVKTSFIRNGSGSTFAKIEAEKITLKRMFGMAELLTHNHKPVN